MEETYTERPPAEALRRSVHCLWSFSAPPHDRPEHIAPDGRCELVVHLGAPYESRAADRRWRPQPRAIFVGQLTRPLTLRPGGPIDFVAARFRPAGAGALARSDMGRFTNRATPLSEIVGDAAAEALIDGLIGAPPQARLDVLETWLSARLGGYEPDEAVERCVDAVYAREGRIRMGELEAMAGLNGRTLQRRFSRAVGAPPRLLASVVRFRRVFEALQDPTVRRWTDAAQAAGYFDHAQMTRDFRRFLGCTPSAFMAERGGLAASLVEDARL